MGRESWEPPIPLTKDLGIMLRDLDFTDEKNPQPQFFRAHLIEGRLSLSARGEKSEVSSMNAMFGSAKHDNNRQINH